VRFDHGVGSGYSPGDGPGAWGLETILVESVPRALSSNVYKNLTEIWRRLGIRPRRRRRSWGIRNHPGRVGSRAFSSNVHNNLTEIWDPLEAVVFGLGLDPGEEQQLLSADSESRSHESVSVGHNFNGNYMSDSNNVMHRNICGSCNNAFSQASKDAINDKDASTSCTSVVEKSSHKVLRY
jgi:hypothetical protein